MCIHDPLLPRLQAGVLVRKIFLAELYGETQEVVALSHSVVCHYGPLVCVCSELGIHYLLATLLCSVRTVLPDSNRPSRASNV